MHWFGEIENKLPMRRHVSAFLSNRAPKISSNFLWLARLTPRTVVGIFWNKPATFSNRIKRHASRNNNTKGEIISLFLLHNITQWKCVNRVCFFVFFCSKNLSGKSDYWQFIWSGFRANCLQTGGSLVLGANHFKLSAASLGRAAEDVPSSLQHFLLRLSAVGPAEDCQRRSSGRLPRR